MKPLDKLAVALRECDRCGNLVVVRYGVPEQHSSRGQPCKPSRTGARPGEPKAGDS